MYTRRENMLADSEEKIRYAVFIKGKQRSVHANEILAEQFYDELTEKEKEEAEIVPITKSGQRFLVE